MPYIIIITRAQRHDIAQVEAEISACENHGHVDPETELYLAFSFEKYMAEEDTSSISFN